MTIIADLRKALRDAGIESPDNPEGGRRETRSTFVSLMGRERAGNGRAYHAAEVLVLVTVASESDPEEALAQFEAEVYDVLIAAVGNAPGAVGESDRVDPGPEIAGNVAVTIPVFCPQ